MPRLTDGSRFSFGADEFVFVELSDEMSLEQTLRVIAITDALRAASLVGVTDICPAHVSYMLRLDPTLMDPRDVIESLEEAHQCCGQSADLVIQSRLIEIPVFYNDPWTRETVMRFRDRHQSNDMNDLEYCASVNGFSDIQSFIEAHSGNPFIATFIGFMPGNAESYQLVPRKEQLQAPKYLRPRTDTPARALGHGGAFTTVYPVRGAGGFQLLGRAAVPVFDPESRLDDFGGKIVLPRAGDIFKYRPIEVEEYEAIRAEVEEGHYTYTMHETTFDLAAFQKDPPGYNAELLEVLR
ncbi:MAG: carboxyltransferase domain-containing protein [Nocardioides sp.]|nr:carboxyltransferase domain-containing protein [Nocardioides sp.]